MGFDGASASKLSSLLAYSSSEVAFEAQPSNPRSPLDDYATSYAEDNWDGSGGRAITVGVITSATHFYNFLSPWLREGASPNIAPGSDGTIGFEWRSPYGLIQKIFVEIRAGDKMRAYWVNKSGKISRLPLRGRNLTSYNLKNVFDAFVGKG